MPAPTLNPLISSVPYFGPTYVMGEVTDQFQPVKVTTWDVVIPTTPLGNEAKCGYAAFTADGQTVVRGFSGASVGNANYVGWFADYSFWEGDAGSNPYQETFGGQFTVPVLSQGTIFVYNSTSVSVVPPSSTTYLNKIVIAVDVGGITPTAIKLGSLIQGPPAQDAALFVTTVDVSAVVRVRVGNTVVGGGVLISVVQV